MLPEENDARNLKMKRAIRHDESLTNSKAHHRSVWQTPAIFVGVLTVIGSLIIAMIQGYDNTRLERQKFEASLILKALETGNYNEAATNLKFLVTAGLISVYSTSTLLNLAKEQNQLPTFAGAAIRDELITVKEAKIVLNQLGFYSGELNEKDDPTYRRAIAKFQFLRKIETDGLIGHETLAELWSAVPEKLDPK